MTTPVGLLGLEPAEPHDHPGAKAHITIKIGLPDSGPAITGDLADAVWDLLTKLGFPPVFTEAHISGSDPEFHGIGLWHAHGSAADSGPTGEELRARYGTQAKMADEATVARLLGCDEIDPFSTVAYRYDTLEAFEAFADGNRRHYGHKTIGPVPSGDGGLYALLILNREP
jgi:hypothetical protein